ncbi:hypothetical protein HanXRQr2_Chr16g0741941 [Helianthus annuus]|uniref:Uncharacterized protein n=1 Tax=Helianthus annuus TaxID=4232 RepID=A0A9K3GXD2_HELAN|nr:hypothetical protein HanXRQr2_Chr16g0741941 [Helianthus annuus]
MCDHGSHSTHTFQFTLNLILVASSGVWSSPLKFLGVLKSNCCIH